MPSWAIADKVSHRRVYTGAGGGKGGAHRTHDSARGSVRIPWERYVAGASECPGRDRENDDEGDGEKGIPGWHGSAESSLEGTGGPRAACLHKSLLSLEKQAGCDVRRDRTDQGGQAGRAWTVGAVGVRLLSSASTELLSQGKIAFVRYTLKLPSTMWAFSFPSLTAFLWAMTSLAGAIQANDSSVPVSRAAR